MFLHRISPLTRPRRIVDGRRREGRRDLSPFHHPLLIATQWTAPKDGCPSELSFEAPERVSQLTSNSTILLLDLEGVKDA
jgi:hypothetical protein